MPIRQVIAALLFGLTVCSCNDASFSAAPKKDDPKKSSDLKKPGDSNPDDPNSSGDANPKDPADCTATSKEVCVQKRKDEGVEESFRSVDCKGKAKADCNASIADERKKKTAIWAAKFASTIAPITVTTSRT